MKSEKKERSVKPGMTSARKQNCGYRLLRSCANCQHCARNFRGMSHAEQMIDATCRKNAFTVSLDHGLCDDFLDLGLTRRHGDTETGRSRGDRSTTPLRVSVPPCEISRPKRKTITRRSV